MTDYNLDYDETVLCHKENVLSEKKQCDIAITNKNFIIAWKNRFGKTKNVEKHPLGTIKIFNGQPQISVSRRRNDLICLEVYFWETQMEFFFAYSIAKIAAQEMVSAAYGVLCPNQNSDVLPNDDSNKIYALPGTEILAKTIKGTMDVFKNNLVGVKRLSKTCENCGASVSGIKGRMSMCPYCNNLTNF